MAWVFRRRGYNKKGRMMNIQKRLSTLGLGLAAFAFIGCSGVPSTGTSESANGESTKAVTEAITTCTPNLSVRSATISSSNKISFLINSPYTADLYLALVTVVEDSSLTGTNITGVIHPGSNGTHGGYATINVSPQVYNQFATLVTNFTGLTLELCYDSSTFTPTQISLDTI
jgi:hypothetical protein